MKVKIGSVEKMIPKQYAKGISLLEESDMTAPDKLRLTDWERFRFAEAAWRVGEGPLVQEYLSLNKMKPTGAVHQYNRFNEERFCVDYIGEDELRALTIVPKSVVKACPSEHFTEQSVDFKS